MEFISELIITPKNHMNYSSFNCSNNGKKTRSFPFDLNPYSARFELFAAYCIHSMMKGIYVMFKLLVESLYFKDNFYAL